MRAFLRPRIQAPGADTIVVTMLARTGNRRIKVQSLNGGAPIFAADRYRLFSEADSRRRITESEFATLPWQGAGPDPDTASVGELLDHLARPA